MFSLVAGVKSDHQMLCCRGFHPSARDKLQGADGCIAFADQRRA
ncbi:MAG: hypothetical protein ACD_23C00666G0007, partial [uncultured bacterium]